jgi:hypothetical protein
VDFLWTRPAHQITLLPAHITVERLVINGRAD